MELFDLQSKHYVMCRVRKVSEEMPQLGQACIVTQVVSGPGKFEAHQRWFFAIANPEQSVWERFDGLDDVPMHDDQYWCLQGDALPELNIPSDPLDIAALPKCQSHEHPIVDPDEPLTQKDLETIESNWRMMKNQVDRLERRIEELENRPATVQPVQTPFQPYVPSNVPLMPSAPWYQQPMVTCTYSK